MLPADFKFLRANPSVIIPFRFNRATVRVGGFCCQGIARLKPGVSIAQANADIERLLPSMTSRFPLPPGFTQKMFDEARFGSLVRPLDVDVVGDIGNMLWILLGTVGLVLLVACANVANLFLVRAEARQQELAIRLALGAEARQVAWQLMAESLLVALVGGVLGVGLAYGGIQLLLYLQPAQLPRLNEITIDPIVLLFTLAVSLIAGVLFGAIPILKYARPQLAAALKDSSRGSSEGRERHRARNSLVVAQVALAAILLVASGLMVRTFMAIRDVPPGFQHPEGVLTLRISIPAAVVNDPAQTARTHEQIVRKLEAVAGVESVGVASEITMGGNGQNDPIWVEDFPHKGEGIPPLRRFKYMGDGYFTTMGNPVVAGRGLTWNDSHTWSKNVLISDNLAREYWGEPAKALGRRIRRSPQSPWYEIVGVVGNERQDGATQPAPTIVYWPMLTRDSPEDVKSINIARSLAYVIRSTPPAVAGIPRRSATGGVERQSQPAAGARQDHAADLRRVDGADLVHARHSRHCRSGHAAARRGRHLRRRRLHRLAAPARDRHPHGARRARRRSAADVHQPRRGARGDRPRRGPGRGRRAHAATGFAVVRREPVRPDHLRRWWSSASPRSRSSPRGCRPARRPASTPCSRSARIGMMGVRSRKSQFGMIWDRSPTLQSVCDLSPNHPFV